MSKWKTFKLGDVVKINPSSIGKLYHHQVIEYLDIASVGTNVCHGTKTYDLQSAPGRAKRLVQNGDTIVSTVRPNLKSFWKVKNPQDNLVVSTGFAVLRPSAAVDSDYLFYSVSSQEYIDYLSAIADSKTTSYPAVDSDDIANSSIALPPIKIQQKIGAILSAYDDLIENNTRRIAILEAMAQRLYREWFVHFRFPGCEKTKMVESEIGAIPKGWNLCQLGEIADFKYGKGLRKEERVNGNYPVYGSSGIVDYHSAFLIEGPGVIIGRKGNVGSAFFSDNHFYPIDTVYYTESQLDIYYLFYLLRNMTFISGDSAVPGLNRESALKMKVLIPDQRTISLFSVTVSCFIKQKNLLDKKNANLCRTRDLLLSPLILGRLDVSELDVKIA